MAGGGRGDRGAAARRDRRRPGLSQTSWRCSRRGIGITVFVTVVAFALASALGLGLAVCVLSGSVVLRQRGALLHRGDARPADPGAAALHRLRRGAGAGGRVERAGPAAGAAGAGDARPVADVAGDPGAGARLRRLHRRGVPRRHPVGGPAGQVEAAKALGLCGWQRFRLVVFPQAIRTILPPLGNDFVALVKDSAWSRCSGSPTSPSSARSMPPGRSATSRPTTWWPSSTWR